MLGPDAAGFRALILTDGAALSPQSVEDMIDCANNGLPILISGNPTVQRSAAGANEGNVLEALQLLNSLPTVHQTSNGTAATALESLGVSPFVAMKTNRTWMTSRRHDASRAIDFIFLIGNAQASPGEITVASSGTPNT